MSQSWKEALQAKLLTLGNLTALVSTRVAFQRRRQGDVLPAVTFYGIAMPILSDLDGNFVSPREVLLSLECWGSTGLQAEAVARTLRPNAADGGLHGFAGTMGTLHVQRFLFMDGGRDDYLPGGDGTDTGTHSVILEAVLTYEEP